ncbi:uncharacterized protein LOC106719796 [Papilio machaon]|uniref:uncharacterized protein LOC106719796 n=1 Tax=Papilio machaon TaxID=76193 RepID=UPI001E6634ED|nr:uncharacterized protein LOC106719796 [Papilio machaon]
MTKQQLKNSGKLIKKTCMPKNDVTEDQVGEIDKGKFIEDRNVMCYIACVYSMGQAVKNNKIIFDAMIKQVDMMFPADMKEPYKAAIEKCKGVAKNYKDICEASYWTAKCIYEADPDNFFFQTSLRCSAKKGFIVMGYRIYLLILISILTRGVHTMTRQQLKNSAKMLKKTCMAKNDVTEDLIGDIQKGQFIEERNVMCYIACIYQMSQIVKNNKLSYEASLKQVDMMYPPELKTSVKASIENCKDISKKYADICEASYWTAKCLYEDNPKDFIFA